MISWTWWTDFASKISWSFVGVCAFVVLFVVLLSIGIAAAVRAKRGKKRLATRDEDIANKFAALEIVLRETLAAQVEAVTAKDDALSAREESLLAMQEAAAERDEAREVRLTNWRSAIYVRLSELAEILKDNATVADGEARRMFDEWTEQIDERLDRLAERLAKHAVAVQPQESETDEVVSESMDAATEPDSEEQNAFEEWTALIEDRLNILNERIAAHKFEPTPDSAESIDDAEESAPAADYEELEDRLDRLDRYLKEGKLKPASANAVEVPQDGSTVLLKVVKMTYADAYESYDEQMRSYVDRILTHAQSKPDTALVESERYATVYHMKKMVVRLQLKKDAAVANLVMDNARLRSVAQNAAVGVRQKPLVVKVASEDAVDVVCELIDAVYDNLLEERREREELKRQRRREKRALKAAQTAQAAQTSAQAVEPDESTRESTQAVEPDESTRESTQAVEPDESTRESAQAVEPETAEQEQAVAESAAAQEDTEA